MQPKRFLIVSDKFKYTFSSEQIGYLIAQKLQKSNNFAIKVLSVSDGGEGFITAIKQIVNLKFFRHTAYNPLLDPTQTFFAFSGDTAYIESAQTCGIELIPADKRNPMNTTSFGLGEQIKAAINNGAKKIYIGLGGSATNDAGIGMATALGWQFLDKYNRSVIPIGQNLQKVKKIIPPKFNKTYSVKIYAATDVDIFMTDKNGAAYTFAKQKGADYKEVKLLNQGLKNILNIATKTLKLYPKNIAGDGAAGGLGFGLRVFCNAQIISGSDYILNLLKINELIKNYDIIITGEGKFDAQSLNGKITGKICNFAQKHGKKAIVIAGISEFTAAPNCKIYPLFAENVDIQTAKALTEQQLDIVLPKIIAEIR